MKITTEITSAEMVIDRAHYEALLAAAKKALGHAELLIQTYIRGTPLYAEAVAELTPMHEAIYKKPPLRLVRGGRYNFANQAERLVYLGRNGAWHQFEALGHPGTVWAEVQDSDLHMIEATRD